MTMYYLLLRGNFGDCSNELIGQRAQGRQCHGTVASFVYMIEYDLEYGLEYDRRGL